MAEMVDPRTGVVYGDVPEEEVGRARTQFGMVTPDEWALQQKYGGTEEQVKAAGKLAANVATLGLAGFDQQQDKDAIRVFRDKSPTLAMLTEAAGALPVGVVAGGGAGLVARGLGMGATAGTLGAAAAEEVASAFAVEREQAAEQDRGIELTNVLSGIPLAAGMSIAGRIAAGAVGRRVGAHADIPGRLGPAEAGARRLEEVGLESGDAVARASRASAERRSVGAAGATDTGPAPMAEREIRDIAQNFEPIKRDVEQLGYDAIEDTAAGLDPAADGVLNVSLKKEDFAGKMLDADPELMMTHAEDAIRGLEDAANKLDAQGAKAAAKTLREHVTRIGEAYTLVDEAPHELSYAVDRAKAGADRLRTKYGGIKDAIAENIVADLDEAVEPIRKSLEDPKAWGSAWAEHQAYTNARWSAPDGIIRSGAVWQKELLQQLPGAAGRARSGLREIPVFKVRGDLVDHVLAMNKKDYQMMDNAISAWIDNVRDVAQIKTELGLPSVDAGPYARAAQGLEDMQIFREQLRKLREVKERGGDVLSREAQRAAAASAGELAFEAAQQLPFGAGAALRGADVATEKLTGKSLKDRLFQPKIKPRVEDVTREVARENIRRRGAPEGRAVAPMSDTLGQISRDQRQIRERAALGLVAEETRGPPLPGPELRFQGTAPSLEVAYQAKMDALRVIAADPRAMLAGAQRAYGSIAEGGHPRIYGDVVARMQTAIDYLQANAPPSVAMSMARPNGLPPDTLAMAKFASQYEAALNPGDVIYDVGTGRATPTQIRTLQAVHPDIYQSLRTDALKQVAAAGDKMPFETKRTLDVLFELEGAAGPSWGPGMTNTLAAARAQKGPASAQSLGGESVIAPTSATAGFSNGPTAIR